MIFVVVTPFQSLKIVKTKKGGKPWTRNLCVEGVFPLIKLLAEFFSACCRAALWRYNLFNQVISLFSDLRRLLPLAQRDTLFPQLFIFTRKHCHRGLSYNLWETIYLYQSSHGLLCVKHLRLQCMPKPVCHILKFCGSLLITDSSCVCVLDWFVKPVQVPVSVLLWTHLKCCRTQNVNMWRHVHDNRPPPYVVLFKFIP